MELATAKSLKPRLNRTDTFTQSMSTAPCNGDLDPVYSAKRLGSFVNCFQGFPDSPTVIDGETDVFLEVFGNEASMHARTAGRTVFLESLPD